MSASASSASPASRLVVTVPIACQICLGKARNAVVCPNLHVLYAGSGDQRRGLEEDEG